MAFWRSLAKSVTWRLIGLALLGGLSWILTGNLMESLLLTVLFNGIRLGLFVVHEEVWERWPVLAKVGRSPDPSPVGDVALHARPQADGRRTA